MTRAALILAAVAALAFAQSRITGGQLRGGSGTPTTIVALDGSGQFHALRLGAGVTVSNGEVRAELPPPTRLTPAADGSYPAVARIARNGLVQCPGVDYAVVAGRIVPSPAWNADDLIVAF